MTIHIHDREVTWNESISDSFDVALSSNGTQINFTDIVNVWECSCSLQTQQHTSNQSKVQSSFHPCADLTFIFFSSVSKTFSSIRKGEATFCSFIQNMKTQVVWTIHVPLDGFAVHTTVSLRFYFFYEQLEDCGVDDICLMYWKPLRLKRWFAR